MTAQPTPGGSMGIVIGALQGGYIAAGILAFCLIIMGLVSLGFGGERDLQIIAARAMVFFIFWPVLILPGLFYVAFFWKKENEG